MGWIKTNGDGTTTDGEIAIGSGSGEAFTVNGVTWDFTNNYFTVPDDGYYEVLFVPVVACAVSGATETSIRVNGITKVAITPLCHASVDPMAPFVVNYIGYMETGDIVNGTVDGFTAVNIEIGSQFSVKRIG